MLPRTLPRLAAATVACSLALVAGPAYAGKDLHVDATGDVVDAHSGGTYTPAPEEAGVDITRAAVTHSARVVKLQLDFRDLPQGVGKKSDFLPMWQLEVEGQEKFLTVGVMRMSGWHGVLMRGHRYQHVPCGREGIRGVQVKVSESADRVRVTVPRSCLGDPRWVRAGATVAQMDSLDSDHGLSDVSHLDGMTEEMATATKINLPLSPKVRRG